MWSAHCQVKFRVLQCELTLPVPLSWFHHNFVAENRVWRNPKSNGTLSWDDSGPPERRTVFDNHVSILIHQLFPAVWLRTYRAVHLSGSNVERSWVSHNYLFLLLSMTRGVWLVAHKSVQRRRLCILSWNKGNRRRGHQKTTRNWLSRCSATNDTIKTRPCSKSSWSAVYSFKENANFQVHHRQSTEQRFRDEGENHARQTQTVPRWVCSHATPCTQRDFLLSHRQIRKVNIAYKRRKRTQLHWRLCQGFLSKIWYRIFQTDNATKREMHKMARDQNLDVPEDRVIVWNMTKNMERPKHGPKPTPMRETNGRDVRIPSSSTARTCFRRHRVATFDTAEGSYCEKLLIMFKQHHISWRTILECCMKEENGVFFNIFSMQKTSSNCLHAPRSQWVSLIHRSRSKCRAGIHHKVSHEFQFQVSNFSNFCENLQASVQKTRCETSADQACMFT